MTIEAWIALVVQTVIIILAIVAGIRRSERRITKIETKVKNLEEAVKPIPGISRALARLEGKMQ
jgi:hypothetical protein